MATKEQITRFKQEFATLKRIHKEVLPEIKEELKKTAKRKGEPYYAGINDAETDLGDAISWLEDCIFEELDEES